MNYKEKLQNLREEKEITQQEIANALNISRSTYKDYETEATIIPIKHLNALCNYLDISVDYLFDFTKTHKYYNSKKDINTLEAGLRLKEFRKAHHITQKELAKFLHTTQSNISWNEKGRNLLATPYLYALCKKYKVSADYLLTRTDNKNIL